MQILSYVCWFEWRKLGKFIHETEFAIVSFVRSYFSSYDRKFNLFSFFVVVVDVTSGNSSLTYAHRTAACSIVILGIEQDRKKKKIKLWTEQTNDQNYEAQRRIRDYMNIESSGFGKIWKIEFFLLNAAHHAERSSLDIRVYWSKFAIGNNSNWMIFFGRRYYWPLIYSW